MARITLYIPESFESELARLREELGARNLSSWFVEQARRELLRRSPRKEETMESTNYDHVAARLLSTRDEEASNMRAHGRELGRDWAAHHATLSELKRIVEWDTTDEPFQDTRLSLMFRSFETLGDLGRDWLDDNDELRSQTEVYDEQLAAGILAGAKEIWRQVESKL